MEEADFVARRSPVRIGLLIALLAALSLVLLLVDFAEIARNISNRRLAVIDALAVMARVIGGVGLLTAVIRLPALFSAPVEIAISAEGILFEPALKQILPWDRVASVAVRKMSGHRVLAVFIADAGSFPIRPVARWIAALNRLSADYGDINLATVRSAASFDQMVAAVARYVEVEPLRS
ncbi:MAG: hypothetical protein KDD90_10885 [Sphingomonadaceae bacterium]|nr:hypothetical protein [Sphingomonadaceae bacterium]